MPNGTPRPEHAPQGDPCSRCGESEIRHRNRSAARKVYEANRWSNRPASYHRSARVERILGIDGEGEGRRSHRYTYLAASDETGRVWEVANPQALTSKESLDFIANLPDRALIVGYAFFYDLTKILQDLPDEKLYFLFHEDLRAIVRNGRIIYRAIRWEGFRLNYMNRRFTVAKGPKKITVWDIFAFFQSKFTNALKDWKIADPNLIAYIERMKEGRSQHHVDTEVKEYCQRECQYLAQLAKALIKAHDDCGLKLKNFFGAGSTAKSLLKKMDIKTFMTSPPEVMRDAVARSFFGGRFENSVVGPIRGPVYNADINSAYPYQITFLPCLIHGTWSHARLPTGNDLESARLALVHWQIDAVGLLRSQSDLRSKAWGPFPVRAGIGTIAFPLSGRGGWVWKDEFLAGVKLEPLSVATEAWLYHTDCDCRPFRELPHYYRERVKWGKDSKGIVLKLGPNAVYGSLAQSKGITPPFQSWIWASNITSGCRAQLLEAIVGSPNRWDVLMLATDGVWSRKPLKLHAPKDTGTGDLPKPLGGWDIKSFPSGVFCVRPGIYFPLDPTESQLKEVRARGIGKKALYEKWRLVVDAWERGKPEVELAGLTRFIGAKSAIHRSEGGYKRSPDYGEWVEHPIKVSFNPAPKREFVRQRQRLTPYVNFDWESEPYSAAMKSPEAIALMLAELIAEEQPDADFYDSNPHECMES